VILGEFNPIGIVRIIKPNRTAPGFLYPGPHIISVRVSIISQIIVNVFVEQQNQMVVMMFAGITLSGPDIAEWCRFTSPI